MAETAVPRWLEWAREIQALAQTGERYTQNDFQTGRYRRLAEIAAEIVAEHTGLEQAGLVSAFRAQRGYATPKVDVRAAVFSDGRLLLVQERTDGGWTLPGGWADVGDLPSAAAEREVREEAGLEVAARRVVGIYDANRADPMELFHAFKIVFLCELLGGEPTPSPETSAVGFYGEDGIPAPFSGQRTAARHVRDAFAAYRDPARRTVFD